MSINAAFALLALVLLVLSLVNVFVCYKVYRETENAHWASIRAKEESAMTADAIATNRAAFEERLAALFSSSARSVDSATRRCSSSETLTDSAIERD